MGKETVRRLSRGETRETEEKKKYVEFLPLAVSISQRRGAKELYKGERRTLLSLWFSPQIRESRRMPGIAGEGRRSRYICVRERARIPTEKLPGILLPLGFSVFWICRGKREGRFEKSRSKYRVCCSLNAVFGVGEFLLLRKGFLLDLWKYGERGRIIFNL